MGSKKTGTRGGASRKRPAGAQRTQGAQRSQSPHSSQYTHTQRPQSRPAQNRTARPQGTPPRRTQRPAAPEMDREQRRRTDRAINQATVHRSVKGRRRGSRGGNYIMYYILAAIIIIIVLVVLSNTVLFNCTSIEVEGNSRYTSEQIIAPSGLETGQNLLHIDSSGAEKRISAALTYIDMVDVSKVFPTKIKITVKEAEKWFLVSQDGVTAAVSRMGRIVELGSESGLPVVVGYDAAEIAPGVTLTSNDNGKTSLPLQILEKAEHYGITGITQIDITDRFDITVDCGDNITLQLGGIADIDSKFAVGAEVLNYEQANVTINLKNPNKPSAKDKIVSAALPSLGGETAESTAEAAGTSEPAGE